MMTLPALILLGVGLSMDAATITICNMLAYGKSSGNRKWLLPAFFAVFQGLMPLLGSALGFFIADFVGRFSNILMFSIFAVIGGKMVWDGLKKSSEEENTQKELSIALIAAQAFATSFDAFAIGVGFAAAGTNAWFGSGVIAATTFAVCAACLFLGEGAARLLKSKASLGGGVILLIIAIISLFS